MARRVFFSFHFDNDHWRASQVRQIGSIEGNAPISDNQWERVKRGGDAVIKRWIDGQLVGKSCTVVLIGSQTAQRRWVKYEIERSWYEGKGLLGIYIHGLKNSQGQTGTKGLNPFEAVTLPGKPARMSTVVPVFEPWGLTSKGAYDSIAKNVAGWVEQGIAARSNYR